MLLRQRHAAQNVLHVIVTQLIINVFRIATQKIEPCQLRRVSTHPIHIVGNSLERLFHLILLTQIIEIDTLNQIEITHSEIPQSPLVHRHHPHLGANPLHPLHRRIPIHIKILIIRATLAHTHHTYVSHHTKQLVPRFCPYLLKRLLRRQVVHPHILHKTQITTSLIHAILIFCLFSQLQRLLRQSFRFIQRLIVIHIRQLIQRIHSHSLLLVNHSIVTRREDKKNYQQTTNL